MKSMFPPLSYIENTSLLCLLTARAAWDVRFVFDTGRWRRRGGINLKWGEFARAGVQARKHNNPSKEEKKNAVMFNNYFFL